MAERLGPVLRGLRNEAGLTQEELAHESGVSVSTIRRLETGRAHDHRLGTVNLLADALNASPEDRKRLAATLTDTRQRDAEPHPAQSPTPTPTQPPAPEAAPVERAEPAPARTPVPAPSPIRGELADAAEDLAREVRRRLQREEEQRRVHDPFALPVRWLPAPERLMDHRANVERLVSGVVPAVTHTDAASDASPDLGGDLRGVADYYRSIRSGRLVILGRAGAGKSVLTMRLALDLLEPPGCPERVPVVFSLGSWDPTTTALRDWMVDLLLRDHPHLAGRVRSGVTLAAALVQADVILPVLDGFDEIAEGLRIQALQELNAELLPMVVTSRHAEFAEAAEAARSPLVLAAAIELADLTVDHVVDYLPRTARPAADRASGSPPLWHDVSKELRALETPAAVTLAAVLSTPLMVTLARTMYSDGPQRDPRELLDAERFPTAHALEEHLLAGFVPALYRPRPAERRTEAGARRRARRNWDAERAQRWLGYLAHHMGSGERDQQDLAWWRIGETLPLVLRILAVTFASAGCVALPEWLFGLATSTSGIGWILLDGALMGSVNGAAMGALYAVLVAFGRETFEPSRVRLRIPRRRVDLRGGPVRVTVRRLGVVVVGGFLLGAGLDSAITLEHDLFNQGPFSRAAVAGTPVNLLGAGLIFAGVATMSFLAMAVLETPLDTAAAATPGGLLAANRAAVLQQFVILAPLIALGIAFGGFLAGDLLRPFFGPMEWALSIGLFVGSVAGPGGSSSFLLSFSAWGQWLVLSRFWLPLTGRLPWNTIAFLDDAYRRGVLRQTGAVYQFRHLRLQHHLSQAFREQDRRRYAPAHFAVHVEQPHDYNPLPRTPPSRQLP
ncbi:helix-turn-helix domain-containing protein [Kitasatospora acidiphila]|uniref:helix-turn-helix domain-containing protein n=3 Tax=Kitasatospora TaxID=2063 RepID=UPI003C72F8D5